MKQRLLILVKWWFTLFVTMMLARLLFVIFEPQIGHYSLTDICQIMWHGHANDNTMVTYLSWPVAVMMLISVFTSRGIRCALNVWTWIVAALVTVIYVVDAALYPYWDIRLDTTVLFYIGTSPAAAMASIEWWQIVIGLVIITLGTWGLHTLLALTIRRLPITLPRHKVWCTVGWVALIAAMLVPARGGVTVGTMTPARGYYSDNMQFNKATTNPLFSLVYALCHPDKSIKTDYMSLNEVDIELDSLLNRCDSSLLVLDNKRPDVQLIILESFSAYLMPSLGGSPVAVHLDSIARAGVSFTDFYAESFRTDRALSVLHSGYPSLPTNTLLRDPGRFEALPSLARELRKAGYSTHYYYGGDLNFTNCGAYFRSCGFEQVEGDTDFPIGDRLSKWGVPDGVLFEHALAETAQHKHPAYTVIQTSSSHEPFDVPATLRTDDKRLNAFAYTDSCLNAYVHGLKASGRWDNTLIVITADHYGVWPDTLTDPTARHHIPLVLTGGVIKQPLVIDRTGSQSAIAPTLLGLLGIDVSAFPFAQNLLGMCHDSGWAWFSQPDYFALRQNGRTTVVNVNSELGTGPTRKTQAFLQKIYTDYKNR